jgi:hypothetical protein
VERRGDGTEDAHAAAGDIVHACAPLVVAAFKSLKFGDLR